MIANTISRMRPFKTLALVFLFGAIRLLAVSPSPYTMWMGFSVVLAAPNDGGGGYMTFYDESGSPQSGAGANAGESPVNVAWLRPGKKYTVTYTATIVGQYQGNNTYVFNGSYSLYFTTLDGYTVLVNGAEENTCGGSFNTSKMYSNTLAINNSWTVEIRPVANAAPAPAGGFSGIGLGKSVSWDIGLGALSSGQSAGRIMFIRKDLGYTAPDTSVASRDLLYYSAPANNNQITTVMDGSSGQTLRQVMAPQAMVDLVDRTGGGYTLNLYRPADVTWSTNIYTINTGATPWRTIQATSPGSNQLTITETEGSVVRVSSLALTSGSVSSGNYVWTLQEGDGNGWLRTTTHTSTVNGDGSRDDGVVVRTGGTGGAVVAKTKYHYVTLAWGEEVTQVIADPDNQMLTTSYTYFTTSTAVGNYRRVQSVTDPTGNWVSYLYYDDLPRRGELQIETHPFNNAPATWQAASTGVGRSTAYDYTNDYTGLRRILISRLQYTNNVQTGKQLSTATLFQSRNSIYIISRQINDYSSASASQQTTTEVNSQFSSNPDFNNLTLSTTGPDQTEDSYAYYVGTYSPPTFTVSSTGTYFRTNVWHGSSNSSGADALSSWTGATIATVYLLPNKATMDVAIQNASGLVVHRETWVYTGGGNYTKLSSSDLNYDDAGRLTSTTVTNGTTTTTLQNSWVNGRLASTTDVAGTEIDYTSYDALGRVATVVKKGAPTKTAVLDTTKSYQAQGDITTTYTYDGANHATQEVTSSSPLSLTTTRLFDFAGRQTQQVDPGNFTTGYAYSTGSPGGMITTVTLPGGATKIAQNNLDGQLSQVSGTGAIQQNVSYWVDSGAGNMVQQSYAGGVSTAYSNVYSDWLGRTVQQSEPECDGNVYSKTLTYNSNGQLWKVTQPGKAATLFSYDTMGQLYQECLDVNGNNTIDTASSDRISQHTWGMYSWDNGTTWWLQKVSYAYATVNSSSPTQTSSTIELLSGFTAGLLRQSYSYDIHNNVTTTSTSVSPANKTLVTYVALPDSTTTAATVVYNGLGVEAKDQTGVIGRFEYDALGRKIHDIDPRTGTTITAYDTTNGSSLVQSVTDPAGIAQAAYTYDSAGRVATVTNGLNKVTRYDYDTLNHKIHEFGDVPNPVQYDYDSSGRMIKQYTYRGGSGWTSPGTTWPTSTTGTSDTTNWYFQTATGLLQSKVDAAGKSVSFTYNPARQVLTRTSARSVVTTNAYDSNTGELTGVSYADGTPSLSYSYNRLGQAATVGDTAGTRTFSYNLAGTLELQNEDFGGYYGTGRRLT